jgi:peptidoglycan-N-acetylglucosamine deacetylase
MKILILMSLSLITLSCQKSTEADLDQAVDVHIKATTSGQAEDACQKVFNKALVESTPSKAMCKALLNRTNAELSICEDEIADPKFSKLIVDCKSELNSRIQEIKTERNQDTSTSMDELNFKLPFSIQYRDLQNGYTAVTGDVQQKEIVLSFDDGPHPTLSKKVVDILNQVGVKAHFLQVGKHVQEYPEITKMVAKNGHSIGNHSWDHSQFPKLSFAEQIKQIADTNKILIQTIGWVDPFFRYPYGATTPEMNQFLKTHGEANFLWSVDSNDWKKINADQTVRTNAQVIQDTLGQITQRGRGIVLFHDIQSRTIELLPTFLKRLHELGYKIVLLQPSDLDSKKNSRIP